MKKLVTTACVLSLLPAASADASHASAPYNIPPGQYCAGLSKKKIPGQSKTPFAQCVTALTHMERQAHLSSVNACASLKKGAKGKAGKRAAMKAFNKCVAAGKKLRSDHQSF